MRLMKLEATRKTIVNICLTGPFSDGFSYQDNLLSKYHARLGLRTIVIAPTWAWNHDGELVHVDPGRYTNEDSVEVIRIENDQGKSVTYRLKTYGELSGLLEEFVPDIIFLHGLQLRDTKTVCNFVSNHPGVRLFVDNHADDYNSATTFASRYILHGVVWRHYAHLLLPVTSVFWGISDNSREFLVKRYGIPLERTGYLPLGADDDVITSPNRKIIRRLTRCEYGILPDEFLIVTGGKLDRAKNLKALLNAVSNIADGVKLLVFGSCDDEIRVLLDEAPKEKVVYAGWQDAAGVRDMFFAADFVIFPGTASALWMQSVATGVPGAYREWPGSNRVDCGGNALMLHDGTSEEIYSVISTVEGDRTMLEEMAAVAMREGPKRLAYSNLATRSIQWDDTVGFYE